MTNLLQKIGLVLGATAVVAGSAYSAPKQDGVKFTPINWNNARIEYVSKGGLWGYDPNPKNSKVEWKKSDNQSYVEGAYRNHLASNGNGKQGKPSEEKQKKSPVDIVKEACEKTPSLCPKKDKNKTDEKTPKEPSSIRWLVGVGGNSDERMYGEVSVDWIIGDNKTSQWRFGPYVRGYSNVPVEKGKPETNIVLVNEALVGPGIYRTREDRETESIDTQKGQWGAGIIGSYRVNSQLEMVARIGALPVSKIKKETLESTVAFEDSNGNPIGNPETARTELKPKEKNSLVPTIEAGVRWTTPIPNTSLELSGGAVEGQGSKINAALNVNF